VAKLTVELMVVGVAYFILAKAGQTLTAVPAGATPLWPPTGLGLAAVLLCGLRVWPAIFVAAFTATLTTDIADATPAGSVLVSSGIAAGYTLEAVVGGYLTAAWSGGPKTFDTPVGVAKFALIGLVPSTMVGAVVSTGTLGVAGYVEWGDFVSSCFAWWLGDVAGALVITPVIVLWAKSDWRGFDAGKVAEAGGALLLTAAVGFVLFSPLIDATVNRGSLSFLAILPLLWAALRCSPRVTATAALVLACLAAWGTLAGERPFAGVSTDAAFPLLITFMICTAVPSLALSTELAVRDRVEAGLRQQEQDLRAMFSRAVIGIAQLDPSGRFRLVNDRFREIVQRPSAELLRLRIEDVTDVDDLTDLRLRIARAIETGEGFIAESRCVLPDGSRVWLRSNFSVLTDQDGAVRLVAIAEDVTARRRAEENLQRIYGDLENMVHERTAALEQANRVLHDEIAQRKRVESALKHDIAERRKAEEARSESERRFRLFIDAVTDYALCMLDCDGNITSWNTGAQRIHQYAAAEITGKNFSQFYTEEDQQRGEPARALMIAAYEGKHVAEGWRMRRDRSRFWASVVIEAIRDESGSLVGFAEITRDITERREAEAALQRAKEQLAQSQKMEALGQLTGSIAHDFNNLLMIVSGHAQLLRKRLAEPKQLQAIDALQKAASRGESLTRQLLAFSRRQPLSPVVADLRERVEAVRDMLVGSLRGNIELKCDMPAGLWPVEVDIAELELAMVNVAVNARDAMPGGGAITLSAQNVTLKQKDKVDELEGDFVELTMRDTGVGIAPDILARIFEPFFTTKGVGKGTGLGLSQVYGFAQQSGGSVIATSEVGSGTTISIYLPRSLAAVTRTAEPAEAHPATPGEGTVLIVEDNSEVAEVTSSLVEQLGYRTLRAENAADALNRLQRDNAIDLVFSDIVMPGAMNGVALAQVIAKRYPDLPVVLASGYSDMVQAAESRFVVLRKPFQLPAVERAFHEALTRTAVQVEGARVLQFPPPAR
jgi:PAS domain S-box-containing protein